MCMQELGDSLNYFRLVMLTSTSLAGTILKYDIRADTDLQGFHSADFSINCALL